MMENNKSYLRQLTPAFLIILVASIVIELLQHNVFGNGPASYNRVAIFLYFSIAPLALFVSLGMMTNKWTPAIGSFAIYIALQAAQYFYLQKFFTSHQMNTVLYTVIIEVMYILPFFAFFIFCKTLPSKFGVIVFALMAMQMGGILIYRADDGVEMVEKLFRFRFDIPGYIFSSLSLTVGFMLRLIILCELLNYSAGKSKNWNMRLLNPGNEYQKTPSAILFWVLKSSIYFTLLGMIAYMRTFDDYFGRSYGNIGYFKWQLILSFLFVLPLYLAVAWYLRKFMLEYFATYNITSRFLYWFLLLPGIGFIAWLVANADTQQQKTFEARELSIKKFSTAPIDGIIGLYVVFILIRIIFGVTNHLNGAFIVVILLSAGIFFWMVKSIIGYYFNLWVTILFFCLILLMLLTDTREASYYLLYPLLFMNAVQLFLVLPAFHFDAFSYLSYEPEKPWEPGQDLFPENS
jgi:hypothetical protein